MKRATLFLFVLISITKGNSQSYMGYVPDNYAGVQGVLFNPASIVDSRFKTDINLFSLSLNVGNDLYGVKYSDAIKSDYNFDTQAKKYFSDKNNAIATVDVMGPSFMFNIAPKHAIALYSRVRSINNIVDINGNLVDQIDSNSDKYFFDGGNPNIVSNTWGEIGLSYATILLNKNQNFLKGGLTFKYLQGGFNEYLNGDAISVDYKENKLNSDLSTYTSKGNLIFGGSEDFEKGIDNVEFNPNSTGFGFDVGFQYEWRPDYEKYDLNKARPSDNNFKDLNKYKLRFGLSVTDIGSIDYSNAKKDTYKIDGVVTQKMIDDADTLYDFLNTHYTKVSSVKGEKVNLPTAIHANVDWNIHNKFYLNLNGDFGLVDKSGVNKNGITNTILLIPRYESKWFTFSLPINHMEYSGTQVGAALRLGPVFIGSSSVLTNLFSANSKAVDAYVGLKIPVYQNKFKDTDADDVLDKNDACPTVAGPVDNKGCPWPDSDADKVLDKDDACPNVAGPAENKGCPWGDADKDTVLDNIDTCPSIAGPAENNGCPWPDTDGDTVLDKEDQCPAEAGLVANGGCPDRDADKDGVTDKEDNCPTVPGPASNKGCPEITQEALKELKVQARSVFFVTGKAVLQTADKGQTNGRLDAIKEILKNYPNAEFAIEGHTDNVGNAAANQKLSEARAKVVMDALVAKGVNPENLTYKGFGDTKPVATNKTAEGRAENRRTELIHIGTIYEGKL